ncbi:MAG: citryl-CoA lyase [Candidatus Thermoplasmatota archaeon]|nr:citryl-CoA lyase [Candidatus Thermoplasmatota archaeon]
MDWKSSITKVEPNHLITKGYRQQDLIGNIPFPHVVYLLIKGELPSKSHGKMMDAILTSCIDHGVTSPSPMASRVVASGGVPLPSAVAAGILSIGDAHGGAIEKGARFMQNGVKRMMDERCSVEVMAKTLVAESREKHQRILGFGHRVHSEDPRTVRLFALADELKIAGNHIHLAKEIEMELAEVLGKKLPINVDGAIAAVISDMKLDWRLGKAFFLLGRVAGLTAQVYEEQTRFKPMRKMFSVNCEYDGPEERDVKQEE